MNPAKVVEPKPERDHCLYAGLRIGEVINLDLRDVDFLLGCVTVRRGKGGAERTIPLDPTLREALTDWCLVRGDTPGAMFPGRGGPRVNRKAIGRMLDRRRLWVRRQAIWRRKKDCPPGEPRWELVELKSRAGNRVVEIPAGLVPLLIAHRASLDGSNPLDLVFPSETGTPLYPKNVRRRHFLPALQALGIVGVRQHDFRRTFIALHVEAGTHPKLVQERVGHSSISLTMDTYAKITGRMMLAQEQEARFEALAALALPAPVRIPSTTNPASTATDADNAPAKDSDPEAPKAA